MLSKTVFFTRLWLEWVIQQRSINRKLFFSLIYIMTRAWTTLTIIGNSVTFGRIIHQHVSYHVLDGFDIEMESIVLGKFNILAEYNKIDMRWLQRDNWFQKYFEKFHNCLHYVGRYFCMRNMKFLAFWRNKSESCFFHSISFVNPI